MTSNHHIERDVRKMLQRLESNVRRADPCPTHQLEVFRDAAIEFQPGIYVREVDELHRVIGDQKAFFVERRFRVLRIVKISLEDVGSDDTKLAATVHVRNKLRGHLRQWNADVAGPLNRLVRLETR